MGNGKSQFPHRLGEGYDNFASVGTLSTAINFQPDPKGTTTTRCVIRFCEGIQSLNEVFGISASASAGIPGVAKIESKVEFVRQFEATSRSLFLVVHAKHVTERTLAEPRFAQGLQPPRNRDEAASFYHLYGDSFTSSISEGAEYAAVYEFYTETTKQSEDVKATLGASGVFDGVEVSAEIGTSIGQALIETRTTWTLDQLIIGHQNLRPPEANSQSICAFALSFVGKTPDAPAIVSFSTTGYEQLMADRSSFREIAENRRALDEPHSGVAALRTTRYEIKNQGKWLRDVVYKAFGYSGDSGLEERLAVVQRDLDAQRGWLTTMQQNPTVIVNPPPAASLDWGIPRLNSQWVNTPEWGGSLGDGFNDIHIDPSDLWIVRKIQLKGKKCIDKLKVTYTQVVGSDFSSTRDMTTEHGGDGGDWDHALTLDLNQHERITELHGWTGKDGTPVTRLSITTSLGQSIKFPEAPWPSKSNSAVTFESPTVFVGFKGYASDNYVTGLTAGQIRILPATWNPA